jgi:hypothetical protein
LNRFYEFYSSSKRFKIESKEIVTQGFDPWVYKRKKTKKGFSPKESEYLVLTSSFYLSSYGGVEIYFKGAGLNLNKYFR